MSLHSLLYESQANQLLSKADLVALLDQSRRFNQAQAITGLLLYTTDGRFFQVLEGEAAALTDLYARIAHDPRHRDVRLLVLEPLATRRFPTWGMGFRCLAAADLAESLGHVDTHNAAFLLPLLPALSNALLDKLLDHVHGQPA